MTIKQRILHECSCIIEFTKLIGKTDKMLGQASYQFSQQV